MRNLNVKNIALCGLLAAVAIVIMSIGTLLPFATYACPVLCALVCNYIRIQCGVKWSLLWYISVAILSFMIGPDKEAAIVFLFLGCYPCVKSFFEKMPVSWLLKLIYFNLTSFVIYWISVFVLGLSDIINEFEQLGLIGTLIAMLLINITLFMMDFLMSKKPKRKA